MQASTPFHDTGWTRKSKCRKSVTEEATTGVDYDGVVKGYGYVFALRDSGVLNFEYDLICALQVRVEGFEPADIENVVSEIGIFLSPKFDNMKGCRVNEDWWEARASVPTVAWTRVACSPSAISNAT